MIFSFNKKIKLMIAISAIMIIFLLILLFKLNSYSPKVTKFQFDPDKGIIVENLLINIKYNTEGKDGVSVSLELYSDSIYQNKHGLYLVSNDYLNTGHNDNGTDVSYTFYCKDDERREWFGCKSKHCYISQNYTGKIFEKLNSEISNKFEFTFGLGYNKIDKLRNARISITDLSNIDINKVFPEPDFYNVHAISYQSPEKIKEVFENGITFNGESNSRKHSNQYWILIIGTLLGVLFSIIVTLTLELIKGKGV